MAKPLVPPTTAHIARWQRLLPFGLTLLLILVMAIATLIEHRMGTATARHYVYGAVYFRWLWAALALSGSWLALRRRIWQRPAQLLLHTALLLILAGALCTAYFGWEGQLHLREGQASSLVLTPQQEVRHLPFTLALRDFEVQHYPGTNAPSDYVSHLSVDGREVRVSMNRVLTLHGYRFFQSSYDKDQRGTVLSLTYDVWGTGLSYAGYALLLLAMLGDLLAPKGEIRRLLRHRLWRTSTLTLLLSFGAFLSPLSTQAAARTALPTISRTLADSLAQTQVVYADRICPLGTLAKDFCLKIYGQDHFGQLSAEQFLLSNFHYPQAWRAVPIVRIKDSQLRRALGLQSEYASLAQLYNGQHYRLQALLQQERDAHSSLAQAIHATDEQVGLLLMLYEGRLVRPLPLNSPHRLSPTRVRLELLYNRTPAALSLFVVNFLLGVVSACLLLLLRPRPWQARLLRTAMAVTGLQLTLLLGLRWYLSGHAPLSNGFETMLFLAFAFQIVALFVSIRFRFALPMGFLLSGFALLTAHLAAMNPQLTALMPVLASPLLCLHVALCMAAYALLAFAACNSAYALLLLQVGRRYALFHQPQKIRLLSLLNRLLLRPAVYLLFVGIFVGAVWANQSWGRYWAWDAKEVWALITALIYALALYRSELPFLRSTRAYHLFLLLAFVGVIFTYFGVNYLLGGMHSYA